MTAQNAQKPVWHGPLTAKATAYAERYGWTVADVCEIMTGDGPGPDMSTYHARTGCNCSHGPDEHATWCKVQVSS